MVLIYESDTDYITPSGKIYKYYGNNMFYKKKSYINNKNGYVYIGITFKDGINRNRRLHRLLAIAFIPNPNPLDYDVVGHKDNDKSNYDLNNLYWTNTSENTQKAYDDQLAKNDIAIGDSQSQPLICYDNNHNIISVYGSIKEAGRCIDGFSCSSIAKSVDKTTKGRKGYYFKSITKEEYLSFIGRKNFKFSTKYIDKSRKKFIAVHKNGTKFITDNQKQFAIEHGLQQASISHQLQKLNGGYIGDWFFKRVS